MSEALGELPRQERCSGRALETVVGHCSYLALVRRELLSGQRMLWLHTGPLWYGDSSAEHRSGRAYGFPLLGSFAGERPRTPPIPARVAGPSLLPSGHAVWCAKWAKYVRKSGFAR